MNDAALAARQHASHRAFNQRFATRTVELDGGVLACLTPAAPDRSLPNAVLYDDPGAVGAQHGELARLYADAGVRAWTVWVQPGDDVLADALAAAGHAADGTPMRMAASLAEIDLSVPAPEGLRRVDDWRLVGALNDAAYGVTGLEAAFAGFPADGAEGWIAEVGGEAAATVSTMRHEDDVYVLFVATRPDHRGGGLCRGLLCHALREAAAAGAITTSLEGSPMGEPIYTRMGYRALGRFGLWELRDNSA